MDTTFHPPADLGRHRNPALMAGIAGLALCAVGFAVAPAHFYRAWLTAYLLWLGVTLGSMALAMVNQLSGGVWGVFRRIFEASSRTMPLMTVLFVPTVLGMGTLFPWTHADHVAQDAIMQHKSVYLNTPFFLARAAVYFLSWNALVYFMNKWSREQDGGDMRATRRLQRLSGAGLVIYALTITFASVDWVMSLNPHWFSTLFGFVFMGGHGLVSLAFTVVVGVMLLKYEPISHVFKPNHFHDLGKLMFAFVMLWAYFAFSQYLIIFSANLVEEIPYYIARTTHGWQYLALFLIVFHFAVPFSLLLSRDLKRSARRLVLIAGLIIFVRYADLFFLIAPEFEPHGANLHMASAGGTHEGGLFMHWLDVVAPVGIGGVWLWVFFTQLLNRPLLAVGDPYLRESLATEGGH